MTGLVGSTLKETFKSLAPIEEGGINENGRVASPEMPYMLALNLKAPITTAAEDIFKYFFIVFQLIFHANPLLGTY